MRTAVTILSLVVVVATDGPYHLARPAVGAPAVQYQQNGQAVQQLQLQQQNIQTPALLPVAQPQYVQYPQQMLQGAFLQGSGYRYSQPIVSQGIVQQQPQQILVQGYQQQPQPQQQQLTVTQQAVPVQQQIQLPQQYALPQPAPQQVSQQLPQPVQGTLQLQGAVEVAQQVGQVSVQQIPTVNNVQQTRFVPSQPSPQSVTAIRYQQNFNPQTGYAYSFSTNGLQTVQGQTPLPQGYASQAPAPPIQVNTNTISGSLQSPDTRVYSSASSAAADPLDEAVVDRIQNILTENEINTANRAGYVSLVSGVALEGARPSIELTSFVQNSPLRTANQSGLRSLQELANGPTTSPVNLGQTTNVGAIGIAGRTPTGNYAIPFVSNQQVLSQNFLPQTQNSNVYGQQQ